MNQGMRERLLKIVEEAELEHPASYMNGGADDHFCDGHECDWTYGIRGLIPLTRRDIAYAVRLALTQLTDGKAVNE